MGREGKISGNLALKEKNVIVIGATQRSETQKLRVAAYCRVSSDSSDQMNSFAAQLSHYTVLISNKENWTLTDLYADAGISGTSAEKRPDFQRLLSDCRKGLVDKILVKSISRFARNTKECLELIRELKSIGIGVCFEEQNIDTSNMSGELLTAVFAAIAQKESESLSAKMRWSYQYRMKSGTFLPSSVPFGYMLQDKKIIINEQNAEIVRSIFKAYLTGQGIPEITEQLNQNKTLNRKWYCTMITRILSNEQYIGNSLWQKSYATDTLPPRQVTNRGEREQYYIIGTTQPIIDKDTFYAVQALKSKRIEKYGAKNGAQDHIYQKKIFCGKCGTIFKRKLVREVVYWVCRKHDLDKNECEMDRIPEETIHAAFLRIYHKLRLHGETILTQMISDFQAVQERKMLWSLDIVELNKRISDIMDQDQMLTRMNQCGCVDPDIFIAQSNELSRQLREAKREKERLMAETGDDTIPRTQELLESLETMPEFLPALDGDIFSDLIDRITVKDGKTLCFRLKNGLELTEYIKQGG